MIGARDVARTAGVGALLAAALPANLTVTALALARGAIVPAHREVAAEPLTVLVSGGKMTKALALARAFHRAGHRVVLVESARYRYSGHRFSRAVDRFHVVPEPGDAGYVAAMVGIVEAEGVDVYVPVCSPAASVHDAEVRAALEGRCDVVHLGPGDIDTVDDKHRFAGAAAALGLAVPDTHLITDPAQVARFDFAGRPRPYILKSIAYDPIRRLDLRRLPLATPEATAAFAESLPISEANPWILQEFIEGTEWCTHGTVRDGRLQVHCCCRSSAWQLNYEMVDKPDIEAWVRRFVEAMGVTGQLSFDFIEAPDGTVYAIECNPRTHSAITMFAGHPGLAAAYLDATDTTAVPLPDSRPTYWLYHEMWRLLADPSSARERLRTLVSGRDAIFDWEDPLPFLLVHHLQIPSLLLDSLCRGVGWTRIDFNIGKLVQPAGD